MFYVAKRADFPLFYGKIGKKSTKNNNKCVLLILSYLIDVVCSDLCRWGHNQTIFQVLGPYFWAKMGIFSPFGGKLTPKTIRKGYGNRFYLYFTITQCAKASIKHNGDINRCFAHPSASVLASNAEFAPILS